MCAYLAAKDRIETEKLIHFHCLSSVQLMAEGESREKSFQMAGKQLLTIIKLMYPWVDVATPEELVEQDSKKMKEVWEGIWGSMDDPNVQANIEATTEFLNSLTERQ